MDSSRITLQFENLVQKFAFIDLQFYSVVHNDRICSQE